MIRSILVAIPPNGPFCHLARAIWIARSNNADLILLCVTSSDENDAIKSLDNARKSVTANASQIQVKSILRFGPPAEQIIKVAREMLPDLIVLGISEKWFSNFGWSGEKTFFRFLPKSVAARVTQEAPCPILLESPLAADNNWRKAFCVLDLTRRCDDFVRYAVNLTSSLEMQPILFHGVMSTKIYAPGVRQKAVEWQNVLIEKAKREIADIQVRCSTLADVIIESGDDLATLQRSVQKHPSVLLVMDRASGEWGDNIMIYAAVRASGTSVLVRAEGQGAPLPFYGYIFKMNPVLAMFVLWLAIGLGGSLIYLAVDEVEHADLCHLAQMRCDIPIDLLFYEPDTGPFQWGQ